MFRFLVVGCCQMFWNRECIAIPENIKKHHFCLRFDFSCNSCFKNQSSKNLDKLWNSILQKIKKLHKKLFPEELGTQLIPPITEFRPSFLQKWVYRSSNLLTSNVRWTSAQYLLTFIVVQIAWSSTFYEMAVG